MSLKLNSVADIKPEIITTEQYDLAFFASGYEKRAIFLAEKLSKSNLSKIFVLGFKEGNESGFRRENDLFYKIKFDIEIIVQSNFDDELIYRELNCFEQISKKSRIRILVDYSSMSRIWYTAILNWTTFQEKFDEVVIDFYYTVADYKEDFSPLIIDNIIALPGFEGSSIFQSKSIAVFGLGFDGPAALCVFDRLEPDEALTFLADPTNFDHYVSKTREVNKDLIEYSKVKSIPLPISSVENCFRYLSEIVSSYINSADISFIPMGPKPHVLASLLVGLRFRELTCLYVYGRREKSSALVNPTEYYSLSRITFN